jgi:hypothetical protein
MAWSELYRQSINAEKPSPGTYIPIPPVILTGVQPGQIAALGQTSDTYSRPRNVSFYINTYVNRSDYGPPANNSYPQMIALFSDAALLDKWILVDLPPADYTYTIELIVPRWYQNLTALLWLNSIQP